jgi:hypothetical protein
VKSSSSCSVNYDIWARREYHIDKLRKNKREKSQALPCKACSTTLPLSHPYRSMKSSDPTWKQPRSSSFTELQGLEIFAIYEIGANSKTNCPHILGLSWHNSAHNSYRIVYSSILGQQQSAIYAHIFKRAREGLPSHITRLNEAGVNPEAGHGCCCLDHFGSLNNNYRRPYPKFGSTFCWQICLWWWWFSRFTSSNHIEFSVPSIIYAVIGLQSRVCSWDCGGRGERKCHQKFSQGK